MHVGRAKKKLVRLMKIGKALFDNSPNIGIFCISNDNVTLVPLSATVKLKQLIQDFLGTNVVPVSLLNTSLIGLFAACNNKTIIVPQHAEKHELRVLKDHFSEVVIVESKYNTIGNLVSMNDHGTVCSPLLQGELDATPLDINGNELTGSLLFATNKAFLAHRDTSETDLKTLEKVFRVNGTTGTLNLGDAFVKASIVGNIKGVLVGARTSGPELSRLEDVFTTD